MTPRDMTLREYYAGLAMQFILGKFELDVEADSKICAENAVIYADALIAELQKSKPQCEHNNVTGTGIAGSCFVKCDGCGLEFKQWTDGGTIFREF